MTRFAIVESTVRKVTYPIRIDLSEVPLEGRHFKYDSEGKELSEVLSDLIEDRPYRVDFHVRPLGNVYEVSGEIGTTLALTCARCGRDFQRPSTTEFRELVVVEKERPRGSRSDHVHHEDAGGLFCNYQTSDEFDVAEYIHEQIASSEPLVAHCELPDCEKSPLSTPPEQTWQVENPFAALKDLKLKK
jgi:uncharacterized metal-binding protein YceD (DUF177 family)